MIVIRMMTVSRSIVSLQATVEAIATGSSMSTRFNIPIITVSVLHSLPGNYDAAPASILVPIFLQPVEGTDSIALMRE